MLKELSQKAKAINVRELASDILKQNSGLITKLVEQQLTVGESGKGSNVGKYKSAYYARFKQRIGSQAPSGVVDLKLSGDLYKGLFVDFKGTSYETDSKVDYSKYQIKRYGKEIYELQEPNEKDVEFQLQTKIIEDYLKRLGLSA